MKVIDGTPTRAIAPNRSSPGNVTDLVVIPGDQMDMIRRENSPEAQQRIIRAVIAFELLRRQSRREKAAA